MFLFYTGTRGVLQAITTISVAWAGYGIEAILYTNAAVDILISTVILTIMIKETGVKFKVAAFKRTCLYGLPLLGGALAMFVLGALDRWFLVGNVPAHDLAHYAVATKLALAAPLLMQPSYCGGVRNVSAFWKNQMAYNAQLKPSAWVLLSYWSAQQSLT